MTTKYEIVEGHTDEVVATLWWNGKRVECDDQKFLSWLKRLADDGVLTAKLTEPKAMQALADHFRNGYMHMRRAK